MTADELKQRWNLLDIQHSATRDDLRTAKKLLEKSLEYITYCQRNASAAWRQDAQEDLKQIAHFLRAAPVGAEEAGGRG